MYKIYKQIKSAAVFFAAVGLFVLTGCVDIADSQPQVTLVIKAPTLSMTCVNDTSVHTAADFLKKAAEEFAAQYNDAEVDVRVLEFDYINEDEAIVDTFDTGSAADVLFEGYFNMESYIYTGRVVPLNDIITKDMREDISETSWSISSVDDKIYMLPFYSLQNVIMYNNRLMREAGLEKYINNEEIQNWSNDEWEEILSTLAERLPEGIFPMMMYGKNDQGDTHIMTLLRAKGCKFFDEKGNFNVNTPEGVAALQWIKDSYGKGYFPAHCENLEIVDCYSLFENEQMVLYLGNIALMDSINVDDFGCVNFPGNMATSFETGFEVFDNGDEQKLKAAKAFVGFIYENDKWLSYSTSGIPASKKISDKYGDKIFMLSKFVENRTNIIDFTARNPNWRGVRDVFYPHIHRLLEGSETPQQAAEGIDRDCNAAIEQGRKNSVLHE